MSNLHMVAQKAKSEAANLLHQLQEITSDEETIADTIEGEGTFDYFFDLALDQLVELEVMQQAMLDAAGKYKARAELMAHRHDKIRQLIQSAMEQVGSKSYKLAAGTITLRETKGKTYVYDEDIVPDEYKKQKITISIDKTALRAALDKGKAVPGAQIGNKTKTITIRRT